MDLIGTKPRICFENRMVPICGRSFWGNNNGARLFCQMLGKVDGVAEKVQETLTEDAYVVGKCSASDTQLTACTAECNKNQLGGKCQGAWGSGTCSKGSKAGPKVTCFGKLRYFGQSN